MRVPVIAMLLATTVLAGCTSTDLFSSKTTTSSPSTGSVSLGDRISGFITGSTPSSAAASTSSSTPTSEDFDCPRIDIRPGASTLLMNATTDETDALGLRYQGTFVRAARECRVQAPNVSIKVGLQGRIIVGPSGGPGMVTVPLRYALVQEGLSSSRVLWSKLYVEQVQVPPQMQSVNFTHIQEDIVIPIPPAADLSEYVIYIGFDPTGAAEMAKPKRPAKPAKRPPRTG